MYLKRRLIITLSILIAIAVSPSMGISKTDLFKTTPPELYKWKDWVLSDNETDLCPTRYNDHTVYFCTWPTPLKLEIQKKTGTFNQQWIVYNDTMVALPGNTEAWPVEVSVDDRQAPVVSRDGLPAVFLPKGAHTVAGSFKWLKTPLMLNVPPSVGLVALTLFGEEILSPRVDANGRLWLQKEKAETVKEDRHTATVYRLIDDSIPMLITTQLQLKVSGSIREIPFPGLLIKESLPVAIQSLLPVRIGEGGAVTLQARPGTWDIRITSRCLQPVSKLQLENPSNESEIWSFQAQNQLRMVTLKGVPAIDPSQTEMPPEWRGYPAHILKRGDILSFEETRRGDPDPAPDKLNIHRTLWLDFDGRGFTVRDAIDGALSRSWSISMNPPGELGRVSVNGEDRLITKQGAESKPGIELRKGDLQLEADSRFTRSAKSIPAVGWDHDFQQVSGVLNLPPGWRLFSAAGIDHMPGTWLQNWTLMDIFLTLIISVTLFKLRGRNWGLVSLITLCLIYHEPGAPKTIWLYIIAAMALAKALPEGRFRRLADIGSIASVIVLLVISIPFMVQQLRWGVFPQLEPVWYAANQTVPSGAPFEERAREEIPRASQYAKDLADGEFILEEQVSVQPRAPKKATETYDPDALVQTGPGIPDWQWRSYPLSWNGPVKSDQTVTFRLISPMVNLILSGLRVLMLALLIYCVINARGIWNTVKSKKLAGNMTAALLFFLFSLPALSRAADTLTTFPPQDLLQELEKRLLEKHACYPDCADIPDLEITARTDTLQLLFNIDAAIDTAIPLPVTETSWQPETILLDGQPIQGLQRESSGPLWALIPQGVHRLAVLGNTRSEDNIQLPFILKPHFTSCESNGWDVMGISADGKIGSSIQLTRLDKAEQNKTAETFETSTVPVFLDVERTFYLGITWHVTTTFRHLAATRSSVVLSYPLLSKEAVTSGDIEVKEGKAVITLAPNQAVTFESTLEATPEIRLNAPENVPWTETWVLDAAPIWHCDLAGIPVIHHQDGAGQWRPTWKPWPGETVSIAVSRPEALVGQSVTIDAAMLEYTPGQRYDQANLNLKIRTSRGGQHQIELTESRSIGIQQVRIDGESLPVQQEGRIISFPLHPGANDIAVEWQQASSSRVLVKSPKVKIGDPAGGGAVNTKVTFNMPGNRWILLTGGPRLGPAVLFWSYLIVVVLAAFGLKYAGFTPLKFRHWLLLGIGLTQVPPIQAITVVAWFIALGTREKHSPKDKWLLFNLIQIGLFFLTLLALGSLYIAVEKGLLGLPDMQIAGNGSTRTALNWTQDRVESYMPHAWVITVPIWVYHILMLLWSLWLAFSLVSWLRWGWRCFGREGLWKQRKKLIV